MCFCVIHRKTGVTAADEKMRESRMRCLEESG